MLAKEYPALIANFRGLGSDHRIPQVETSFVPITITNNGILAFCREESLASTAEKVLLLLPISEDRSASFHVDGNWSRVMRTKTLSNYIDKTRGEIVAIS